MYRVTRTIIRGQFANDQCFQIWMASQGGLVFFVKVVDDPLNTGGPNDKRYYLWNQLQVVTMPKCSGSDPDLVTHAGANGWDTQAAAQAVLDYEIGQAKVVADNVAAANAAAVSPGNIASGVASDIGKDAGKALGTVGKGIFAGGPWLWLGLAGVAAGAYYILRK